MIEIDRVLLTDDLLDEMFVCDIAACKGACCVEGESGAPLEEEEAQLLKNIFPKLKPFLRKEGLRSIEKQGCYITDSDGDLVTPLIKGKECAYTVFETDGTATCGIEKAWKNGAVSFQKPISCHLYPARIIKLSNGTEAINYHRWKICKSACTLGKKTQTKVYEFLVNALIRKYGKAWFKKLQEAARMHKEGYF